MVTSTTEPLYIDPDHPKGPCWYCVWYDHAGRKIKRRLGLADSMSKRKALVEAANAFKKHQEAHEVKLAIKRSMTEDELQAIRQYAAFPRAVVSSHIERLCRRIAMSDAGDESRSGRPGIQLFAERAGISSREVHRLIEDDERVAVGYETVDKICTEFEMLFDDFIADAKDWAACQGQWASRPGSEDCWPIGYEIAPKPDIGIDLL